MKTLYEVIESMPDYTYSINVSEHTEGPLVGLPMLFGYPQKPDDILPLLEFLNDNNDYHVIVKDFEVGADEYNFMKGAVSLEVYGKDPKDPSFTFLKLAQDRDDE